MASPGGLSAICTAHPGHEDMLVQLHALFTTHPPPFIYIHDPGNSKLTSTAVKSLFEDLQHTDASERVVYAQVNSVACFTTRVLYDTVINALEKHNPTWDTGCANWASDVERWNENFNSFTHGLKAVHAHMLKVEFANDDLVRMVLVIERAERLKDTMPDIIVPLVRLAELVCSPPMSGHYFGTQSCTVPGGHLYNIHIGDALGGHQAINWCRSGALLHQRRALEQARQA
jgi:origin recognition complex subunit 5